MVEVEGPSYADPTRSGGGPRSFISCWSAASRRRFLKRLAAVDFGRLEESWQGRFVFVTLTYRDDPGPVEAKRHINHWLLLMGRFLGEKPRLTWKMEFQKRGVVHFHALMFLPGGSRGELLRARIGVRDAWHQASGGWSGGKHRVDVDYCRARDVARYIAFDMTKAAKGYQFRVPEAWQAAGRFWAINGLPAFWSAFPVSMQRNRRNVDPRTGEVFYTSEFLAVRRLLRRYRQAHSRRKARFGHQPDLYSKMWVLGQRPDSLIEAVDRYLVRCLGPPVPV